jgi:hypothetical protein
MIKILPKKLIFIYSILFFPPTKLISSEEEVTICPKRRNVIVPIRCHMHRMLNVGTKIYISVAILFLIIYYIGLVYLLFLSFRAAQHQVLVVVSHDRFLRSHSCFPQRSR